MLYAFLGLLLITFIISIVPRNEVPTKKSATPSTTTTRPKPYDPHELFVRGHAKRFITKCLRSPRQADFPWLQPPGVQKLGRRWYRVSGIVYGRNAFNAELKVSWVCDVYYHDDDDVWEPIATYIELDGDVMLKDESFYRQPKP